MKALRVLVVEDEMLIGMLLLTPWSYGLRRLRR